MSSKSLNLKAIAKLKVTACLKATALRLQAMLPLQLQASGPMEVRLSNIVLQFNWATYIYTIKQHIRFKSKKQVLKRVLIRPVQRQSSSLKLLITAYCKKAQQRQRYRYSKTPLTHLFKDSACYINQYKTNRAGSYIVQLNVLKELRFKSFSLEI